MEYLGLWISLISTIILLISTIFISRAIHSLGERLRTTIEEKIITQTKARKFQTKCLKHEEIIKNLSPLKKEIEKLNKSLDQEHKKYKEKIESLKKITLNLEKKFKKLSFKTLVKRNQIFLTSSQTNLNKIKTRK